MTADVNDVVSIELPRYLWGATIAAVKEAARKHARRVEAMTQSGDANENVLRMEKHRAANAAAVVEVLRPIVSADNW